MATILGMQGTGSFLDDSVPGSWREVMMRLFPNGSMPLTGIGSKIGKAKITDSTHHWQNKNFPHQGGAVTNIYTNSNMTAAYGSGGDAGDVLYVKMELAVAYHIAPGYQVILRDVSHYDVDVNAKVIDVVRNGAASKVTVRLLEDDDNGASTDLSDCDYIEVMGNVNPQGGAQPRALAYQPTWYYNYTQIFRNSIFLTRTAQRTKLRGPALYEESKRETLELHGTQIEKALIHSVLSTSVGDNGEPENTHMGILPFIREYASDNMDDYTLNTDYTGFNWLTAGASWLNSYLLQIFKWGNSRERLAICGDGAMQAISDLAENMGHLNIQPTTTTYGLNISTWMMTAGRLNLLTHPLFNLSAVNYNSMIILEPSDIKYKFIDDTTFYPDDGMKKGNGPGRLDAKAEEFLTECTYEFDFPEKWGYLNGVGLDNSL